MKSYKAVELAPAKRRLAQKPHKGQETPKFKPVEYEKPKRGTRS